MKWYKCEEGMPVLSDGNYVLFHKKGGGYEVGLYFDDEGWWSRGVDLSQATHWTHVTKPEDN